MRTENVLNHQILGCACSQSSSAPDAHCTRDNPRRNELAVLISSLN